MSPQGKSLILSATKTIGLARFSRWVTRHHPRIFMWHRISNEAEDKRVSAQLFERQIRLLLRTFRILPLGELIECHRDNGKVSENIAAVTFDDGYYDFVENAIPIMEKLKVPSTLFVPTDFLDKKMWLWPDLIRFFLQNTSKEVISIDHFHRINIRNKIERVAAWSRISDYCLMLGETDRQHFLSRMSTNLGVPPPDVPPREFAAMSWPDVREARNRGVEIGSHTVTHPVLARLDPVALAYELRESRRRISEETGCDPVGFCFPYGYRWSFNEEVKRAVIDAGYKYSVASEPRRGRVADLWEVGRYAVGSSMYEFEKALWGWKNLRD